MPLAVSLLTLCPGLALGAELQVIRDTPVVITIDGALMEEDGDGGSVYARDLPGGRHLVIVRNVVGRTVAEMEVDLVADEVTRLRFRGKVLSVVGSGPIGQQLRARADDEGEGEDTDAPPEAPEPALAPALRRPVPPAVARASGPITAVVQLSPTEGGPGSLEIAGFDSSEGAVFVDGSRISFDPALDSFPVPGLEPGDHQVRIERDRRTRFSGPLEVKSSLNHRCLLEPVDREFALNCFFSQPMLLASASGIAMAGPSGGPALGRTSVADSSPVPVEFILKNSMDMCNVYVDGDEVARFRTNDRRKQITLSAGVHTVEIKDFTEFETWHRGVLTVTPGEVMKIGFGEQEEVEVYNRSGAWVPR